MKSQKRKYETRCWLCGSSDLKPDKRGIICYSCGATYNLIPKPGQDLITMQENVATGIPDASPSRSVTLAARKFRDNSIRLALPGVLNTTTGDSMQQ